MERIRACAAIVTTPALAPGSTLTAATGAPTLRARWPRLPDPAASVDRYNATIFQSQLPRRRRRAARRHCGLLEPRIHACSSIWHTHSELIPISSNTRDQPAALKRQPTATILHLRRVPGSSRHRGVSPLHGQQPCAQRRRQPGPPHRRARPDDRFTQGQRLGLHLRRTRPRLPRTRRQTPPARRPHTNGNACARSAVKARFPQRARIASSASARASRSTVLNARLRGFWVSTGRREDGPSDPQAGPPRRRASEEGGTVSSSLSPEIAVGGAACR
jgi:hypothetical protein